MVPLFSVSRKAPPILAKDADILTTYASNKMLPTQKLSYKDILQRYPTLVRTYMYVERKEVNVANTHHLAT